MAPTIPQKKTVAAEKMLGPNQERLRRIKLVVKHDPVDEIEPIFSKDFCSGLWYHEVLPPLQGKHNKRERKRTAQNVPLLLSLPRMPTQKELDDIGYSTMDDGAPRYMETPFGTIPWAKCVTPKEALDVGFLDSLFELQRLAINSEVQEVLATESRNKSKKTVYNPGITVQPKFVESGVQLGPIGQRNHPLVRELMAKSAILAHEMLIFYFPEMGSELHQNHYIVEASLGLGHEENLSTTTLQINYSKPGQTRNDKGGLGPKFGGLHVDKHDEPVKFTVCFYLSYLDKNQHPGRMILPGPKLTCTTCPFSTVIFKGSQAHMSIQPASYPIDIEQDSPLRYRPPPEVTYPELPVGTPKIRISLVNYPEQELVTPEGDRLRFELSCPAGLAHFVTNRNRMEWKMKMAIKDQRCPNPSPDYWCQRFSWYDDRGDLDFPRRKIAVKALWLTERREDHAQDWQRLLDANESVCCGKVFV